MFTKLTAWKEVVRLIPNSGIQFVDFGFAIENLPRLNRTFIERRREDAAKMEDGSEQLVLLRVPDLEEDEALPEPFVERPGDDSYDINTARALEVYLEKWVPIPVLRILDGGEGVPGSRLDEGPTNWARVRIIEAPTHYHGDGISHFVQIAFDTDLEARVENRPYVSLSPDDAQNEAEFRLACRVDEMGWFLADPRIPGEQDSRPWFQEWVDTWLRELFYDFKRQQRPGRAFKPETLEHHLEHWARYIAFLETLQKAISPPRFKLVDTVSEDPKAKPVDVDLILDVGNSRTCGILIESYPNEKSVDLNNSMVLRIRDLTHPEQVYSDPFSSHVELSQAQLGRYDLSRMSGRKKAFFWPSLVRIGPEAERILSQAEGTEAMTGMSSPKRYLWDDQEVNQEWRFQAGDYSAKGEPPPVENAARKYLNTAGDVISQIRAEEKSPAAARLVQARRLAFSPSSFFTFMIAEIVAQTISMINDPGVRSHRKYSDSPRQLNRIILTLPPATPIQEQRILRGRAEAALRLVWQMMEWEGDKPVADRRLVRPQRPPIHVSWDEATCIQLVYLYGEIARKFGTAVTDYANLIGRSRPFSEPGREPAAGAAKEPSIRVASIDIGGGTSDLMITTYYVEGDRALKPTQNFREGFRLAGDDILRAIIEQLVLPAIERHLSDCGARAAEEIMRDRFGGNRANMSEQQKHLRRQFVLRALQPVGLSILQAYENASRFDEGKVEIRTIGSLLGAEAAARMSAGERPLAKFLLDYLEEAARNSGASEFRLENVEVPVDFTAVRAAVEAVMADVADNLCEAIDAFSCDLLLLSGRPSRLPAVIDLFVERLPITPDRIVPMGNYRAGAWYPFRQADNTRIEDPKTTAAVGGMLCALAERQIENFTLYTNRLALRSTARFIGPLEKTGKLKAENVKFENVDLDSRAPADASEAEILYYAPMRIGFRQLPHERWTATPLYRLVGSNYSPADLPFRVLLQRADVDDDGEDLDPVARQALEARREHFTVTEVTDNDGNPRKKSDFRLFLDTLGIEDGYWLDTGILSVG